MKLKELQDKVNELEKRQQDLFDRFIKEHKVEEGSLLYDRLFDYVYNDFGDLEELEKGVEDKL